MKHVQKRGEYYWYRRRVPIEASKLDTRNDVRLSLKTKDYKTAIIKADIYNREMEQFWTALIQSGNADNLEEEYMAAVDLAKAHGFIYLANERLAKGPLNQIVERLSHPIENKEVASALLGGVQQPSIRLSQALEAYWEASVDKVAGKDENKIRKWRNPRKRAVKDFIALRGDKGIEGIDREDMLAFRSWWSERIDSGYDSDAANKQMRYIRDIIVDIGKLRQLDIDGSIFKDLRFTVTEKQRSPFEINYVSDVLLKNLEGLNVEACWAVKVLVETGARPTEIIGLIEEDIFLQETVPYIWIRRNLKTKQSERKIPLVGMALQAFEKYPHGFNRWSNPDSFTSTVGKYLRDNKLLPSSKHSLYSLRHTFKDRLRDAEAPEEIIDELMGHKSFGPKYGRGHLLEKKHLWLQKIAYDVPRELLRKS